MLERGRNAIETIVRMIILQLLPTILELAMIVGVLLWMFDWRYVVVILVTVAAYLAFTYYATEWRIAIRRDMNDSDTNANVKAIDSLLNFETVKYFSAEEREKARYDVSMAKYEKASTKALTSLAVLNAGQAAIFTAGMTVAMVLCAMDIAKGRNTVGDFVMINAMMIQLYQPLNFMGMVYREIKQAITDIEAMFAILGRPPEIVDRPAAPDLKVAGGTIRFEDVAFAYDPARPILKASPSTCRRARPWRSSARQAPASPPSPACSFRFYDVGGGRITIDGQDIREVSQASVRRAIGMVPQDTRAVQRHDPLQHSLRPLGCLRRRGGGSRAARADPRLHPAQPPGLRDRSGRARLKLSGGEKQRVAIARAMLKSPPILVLDERPSASTAIPSARSRRRSTASPATAPPSSSPTGCRPSSMPTRSSSSTTAGG